MSDYIFFRYIELFSNGTFKLAIRKSVSDKYQAFYFVIAYASCSCEVGNNLDDVIVYGSEETYYGVRVIDNNAAVRKMLLERGIVPEDLPAAEDVKKVERRLASEEKKAVENKKKYPKK